MRWADLKAGMFVRGSAEDFYQVDGGWTPKEIADYEPIFDFEGRILYVTQRKIVIDGWWRWVLDEKYTAEDPQETRGTFGILRRGIDVLQVLDNGPVVDL